MKYLLLIVILAMKIHTLYGQEYKQIQKVLEDQALWTINTCNTDSSTLFQDSIVLLRKNYNSMLNCKPQLDFLQPNEIYLGTKSRFNFNYNYKIKPEIINGKDTVNTIIVYKKYGTWTFDSIKGILTLSIPNYRWQQKYSVKDTNAALILRKQ